MKPLVIIISITLNVFLAYKLLTGPIQSETVEATTESTERPSPERVATADNYNEESATASSERGSAAGPNDIDSIDDLLSKLQVLRIAPDLIKRIVLNELERDYEGTDAEKTPYWQLDDSRSGDKVLASIQVSREKRDLILRLFGDSARDDPIFDSLFRPLDESLAFLDSDRQIAIHELWTRNQATLTDSAKPGFIREYREERLQARNSLAEAIKEILTADEFFEYQLRESRTAKTMLRGMSGFDYGEQEFRDIFSIRQEYDEQLQAFRNFRDPDTRAEMRETVSARDEAVKNYLGADRFDDLQRVQDPMFKSLQAIGERYGTSDRDLIAVYELTNDSREQINVVRNDRELSIEERREQSSKLSSELHENIQEIVGEDAADSIRDNTSRFRFSPGMRAGARRGRF